jgi:transcriptional regulator with XRE-family HTH domain
MTDLDLREAIHKSSFRTQERFSLASGIAEPTISKICRGLREPNVDQLEVINQLLESDKKLSVAERAILGYQLFPDLSTVFEGVDLYADYLKCPFESLVDKYREDKGCSYGEAISATAKTHPELHQKYIQIHNIIGRRRF